MENIVSSLSKMWHKVINLEKTLFPLLKEELRLEALSTKESKLIQILDFAEIEVYWRGKKTRMLECFLGAL